MIVRPQVVLTVRNASLRLQQRRKRGPTRRLQDMVAAAPLLQAQERCKRDLPYALVAAVPLLQV